MKQLRFEGMLEEVDKELKERQERLTITHPSECKITHKRIVEDSTLLISTMFNYFSKYSPESVWGKWLQKQHHVTVTLEGG